MAFQQRKIAVGIAYALGLTAALGAFPAAAQDVRIEVTGTNIRRVDVETVSPVSIITREEITRTGMATVAEVLRSLPANSGSYGESFTNSFAPGASAISLRGLGQKATLVLLNGRRVSGYGFAQNISDTFVDLNSIPSSAVERVEILNDGASAIYGSDALAGVVNVILRTNYTGFESTASVGWYEGINDFRATLTGGMGNLVKDKYNIFGTVDYYKRDLLLLSDTDYGSSRDYRGEGGGRNQASLTTGGTWRQLTASGGLTNNYRAIAECAANGSTVMTGPEAAAAGLINLTPPTPGVPGGQSAASYAANLAAAAASNTFCTRDINSGLTALPETERIGFLGRGTYQFSPDVQFYLEGAYSHNESFQVFTAPFWSGTTALQQTVAGLRPFTYNINFAPGASGNPFGSNARFLGSHWDRGTRDTEITSDSYRVLTGAKYVVAGWDLDSALGWSKNEVESVSINRLSLSGTSAVFGVGSGPQPPVPLSTNPSYNLDRPSQTPVSVYNQMRIDFSRQSESELFFVDTRATTEIQSWKLPGGPVGVAVGVEYRDESLKDTPAAVAQAGDVLGQGITATDGERQSYAAYAELALPITKQIEAQLAARYDHYSDYGSSTTPKVGIKWVPTKELLFRANWGKGFRAPTLPEISKSIATSFQLVTDPEDQQQRQVSSVSSGNEDLRAEKSESAVVGFVIEPTNNASFSMNYYWIDWKDRILRPSSQEVLNASCPQGGPGCPSIPGVVIRDPSNANQVVTVFRSYQNRASVKTTGVDFDARLRIPTDSYGRFVTRINGTYLDRFEEDGVNYAGANNGSYTQPRWRALFALDWDYGPWSATGRINYIDSYRQELLPASYRAAQNPEFQTGTYPNRVPSYTTVDLYGSYRINKNWSVSAAVLNVGDELPQYDPGFTTTELYDWSTYDIRGRQFRLTLNYAM